MGERPPAGDGPHDANEAPVPARERPSGATGDDYRPRHASVHVTPSTRAGIRWCEDPDCGYKQPHRRHW